MEDFEKKNRNYWNRRSQAYSALRQKELESDDALCWQEFLMDRLPKKPDLRILDAGTGPAFLAIILAKAGASVTALDFSPSMLEEAEKNAQKEGVSIRFVRGDVMDLPFGEESFDAVISRNVTWNLPDVPKAYCSWYRVLKRGGVLLNFDSDYGTMDFRVTAGIAKNAHHGVAASLIETCEELKDSIRISTHRRPLWDLGMLQKIGFCSCSVEEDIREKVHRSREWEYDPTPLFCLRGIKK